MKVIWIIVFMALFHSGLAKAGDNAGTNHLSGQVRNLIDSGGSSFYQHYFNRPDRSTNWLGNLHFINRGPFAPFYVPQEKAGWSLWNNSSFKSVGSNYDPLNVFEPSSLLTRYEYDISYTWEF